MNPERLEELFVLAQTLSFSRAASKLGLSQSQLSRHVAKLEEGLGFLHFKRDRVRVEVTAQGAKFIEGARLLSDSMQKLVVETRELEKVKAVSLKIAFLPVIMNLQVLDNLARFRRKYPGIQVRVYELNPSQQAKMLRTGRIDVAFLGQACKQHAFEFDLFDLHQIPLCAIVSRHSPLAARKSVTMTDLQNETFITESAETFPAQAEYIRKFCKDSGFTPRLGTVLDGPSEIICAVADNEGVSILPASAGQLPHPGVAFVPIRTAGVVVTAQAAVARDEKRSHVRGLLQEWLSTDILKILPIGN